MGAKTERIGQVELDLTEYDGTDTYSDGPVERELLEVAQSRMQLAWQEKLYPWPLVYHFHPSRRNLLSWYPFVGTEHVLEIGSGCGALTGLFADRCASVTCCELSLLRSQINAYRCSERPNVRICVGDFARASLPGLFDLVTLIGVLEYARGFFGSGTGTPPALELLTRARSLLRPGGLLFVAIENKFGLKYWAGAREDHSGKLFESIEGYGPDSDTETFSAPELRQLVYEAGFSDLEMYYPFPDYKFASQIFSDERLPRPGDLDGTLRNFDQSRLVVFREERAWDEIIRAGAFPFFSNSFLLIAACGAEAGKEANHA